MCVVRTSPSCRPGHAPPPAVPPRRHPADPGRAASAAGARLRAPFADRRLAVLEAVGRACGIAGRVRGLLVNGRFWYSRFPRLRVLIPHRVVLAWPEFLLGDQWVPGSELYGDLGTLRRGGGSRTPTVRRSSTRWPAPPWTGTVPPARHVIYPATFWPIWGISAPATLCAGRMVRRCACRLASPRTSSWAVGRLETQASTTRVVF